MLRKTVPDPYSSDWKSSVAVESRVWEQTVRETKHNADAFKTLTLLDDEIKYYYTAKNAHAQTTRTHTWTLYNISLRKR